MLRDKMLLTNKMLQKPKTKRESLFPLSNFTAYTSEYGLKIDKSIMLWAKENGIYSEIDLNEFIGFSAEHGRGFHLIKNGKGFYNDPIYKSSKLTDVDGYCRIVVTTKDNIVSWLDLDYFIGFVFHELCTNWGQYERIDSYYSNEEKSRLCQYYKVTIGNQSNGFSLFGFKIYY
jgi:hypothetical protein